MWIIGALLDTRVRAEAIKPGTELRDGRTVTRTWNWAYGMFVEFDNGHIDQVDWATHYSIK